MLRHGVERARHCWRATARAHRGRDTQALAAALSRGARGCTPGAIDDIVALLGGERRDLNHVTIDVGAAPEFHRRVYEVARHIPAGATLSYGEVAERLGDRKLARDVAEALSENPCPIIVPCHRILAAGGKPGGFSAPGGVATKLRLLTRRPHAVRPVATGRGEATP